MLCLKFGDNVVFAARPDGGTGLERMQRGDEIGQRRHGFGQPRHIFPHLLGHVRVARADGLEPQLAAEAQRCLIVLERRAAVEHLHAAKAAHIAQMLAQAPVVVAEGVAGDAKAVSLAHKVDEVLRIDAAVGDGVDAPGGDVAPEREEFHAHEDGEADLAGIGLGALTQAHAVVVGDADRVQPPFSGDGNDLLQAEEAVGRVGAFVQVHINKHGGVTPFLRGG